ncbi:hypothetical protein RchiOBHm_Chr2g0123591 [Rosa chinensis]|uniref:Uncharacterized protein n=1 Tax=Rosa chinensis TaxID=74649 RepID=A0A2P6RT29_ROSCH|nr:hypothetical protein RchiOBHm_Chr2g0123591 [Rosa chinensis]
MEPLILIILYIKAGFVVTVTKPFWYRLQSSRTVEITFSSLFCDKDDTHGLFQIINTSCSPSFALPKMNDTVNSIIPKSFSDPSIVSYRNKKEKINSIQISVLEVKNGANCSSCCRFCS